VEQQLTLVQFLKEHLDQAQEDSIGFILISLQMIIYLRVGHIGQLYLKKQLIKYTLLMLKHYVLLEEHFVQKIVKSLPEFNLILKEH
jgi:hypothetical protein